MHHRIFFSSIIGFLVICIALCIPASVMVFQGQGEKHPTFVIDAGHGGEDGGAVGGDDTLESDINLAIALRLDQLLGLCGLPAILTRNTPELIYPDTAVTIREKKRADQEYRVSLVNRTEAAVLLSIHQNKYSSPGPRGAQVFYGKVDGSEELAKEAQAKLAVLCGDHRKAAPISPEIYLMREAHCPAILVECGFLSNPEELALLGTETYQTKLALAITAACISHYDELESVYGKG
ncbi:MAG: N-acetylmuramoyl-L-alanine amidase [Oscillospiraceae bacterium]|nr:N-acetylmuramoyl-L-alanine amidase [Oscillospiraceae bacterium]